MKVLRGYKTELDVNDRQRTACLRHAGAARYSYNWGLQRKIDAYQAGQPTPTAIDLHRELNALKQTELGWMYEVSKCAPQEALRDLDRAFAHFFRRTKLKKQGQLTGPAGFPRFKSRKRGIGSFRLTGSIRVFEDAIQLPRLGRLRLKERGYLPLTSPGPDPAAVVKILSATVSERAGRWFVSLQVEMELPDPEPAQGAPVGVDLGVQTLATCSDGTTHANPKALGRAQEKLRRLQRQLARQQPGSRNREKTRRQIARLHYRISNIRHDALHQATSRIVAKTKSAAERPRVVVIEDLNVSGMLQNHHLAQAIADVGLYEFGRQVTYKAAWAGSEMLVADRWYPSSKRCSQCGTVKDTLDLSERVYVCACCGLVLDRDLNAACNLAQLVSTVSSTESQACREERLQPSGSAPRGSRNRTAV
ncbi:MAG: transposase [Chloroflexi bacterium]|nr:transposase [Chloroflexota bacterium]